MPGTVPGAWEYIMEESKNHSQTTGNLLSGWGWWIGGRQTKIICVINKQYSTLLEGQGGESNCIIKQGSQVRSHLEGQI